jgi:hypothetical protein
LIILYLGQRRPFASRWVEPETDKRRRLNNAAIQQAEGDMTIDRALAFSILLAAIATSSATPELTAGGYSQLFESGQAQKRFS